MSSRTGFPPPPALSADELSRLSERFEKETPEAILRWAWSAYRMSAVMACSFQDCVLIDMAASIAPGMEIIFLDTGAHFPETLAFVDEIRERYDLNLRVTHPGPEADAWPCGSERCCEYRKIRPLSEALAGKAAWITAVKRVDAATREQTPIVSFDAKFNLVKINPLATWTDEDVESYRIANDLPLHPLIPKGYLSIGCAPTTLPVKPGEHPRSGRFVGMAKTECGIHDPANSRPKGRTPSETPGSTTA